MEFLVKSIIVHIPLKEASLSLISHDCDDFIEYFKRDDYSLNIGVKLNFKILYTSNERKGLSIFKHSSYTFEEIPIREKINGIYSSYIDFKAYSSILNSKILSIDSSGVRILILMRIGGTYHVEPSVLFIVKDENKLSYLYASDKSFKNLRQINFTPKAFNNLCFSNYNNGFLFLNNDEIINYSFVESRESILLKKQFTRWFYMIKKGKALWLCDEKEIFSLYYNGDLLYRSLDTVTYILPLYAGSKFCVLTNEKMIILNLTGNVIFNESLMFSKIVINNEETFGVGNRDQNLFLVNLNTKEVTVIKKHLHFKWYDFYSSHELLILGSDGKGSIIGLLNIFTNEFNLLLKEESEISSIDMDDKGDIYYASNILGLFNLYKLENLKTPKLVAKLFSKNLEFKFRK
ncbi:MAG: hypothetical protein ACRC2K_03035 [Clostridium sp.]